MEKLALGKKGLEVSAIGLGITFLESADMYGAYAYEALIDLHCIISTALTSTFP